VPISLPIPDTDFVAVGASSDVNTNPLSEPAQAPKRERRKDARPGELLAAALDLFVEKGFAATRAEEVAQRAGVSKGTLFLYFASKEELFKAVVRENISSHYPDWHEKVQAHSGSTADMLHKVAQGWWDNIGSTKASGIEKLMMSEGNKFPDLSRFYQEEVIEPGNQMILRILQHGVERGEFRNFDLKYVVHCFIAPMLYLVVLKHSLGADLLPSLQLDPKVFLATQIDVLLNGICLGRSA
jgi:TetR/AcrR family transcriptional regulator